MDRKREKAIILAGGEGRRLRPITGEHPKPMVPLLGRPMMEHILLLLAEQGFTEVCAALKYRAEEIMDAFSDGGRFGLSLRYVTEDMPLGTAGAVRHCADFLGDDDFLVISGDAACDFDLRALMQRHRESGAAVTLALFRDSAPLQYGLTVTDAQGRVRSFIEKPRWDRVVTDLVNTGIYAVSPRVLPLIPGDRPFDFAKDLFPLLLEKGERLLGLPMEGYWCDVGTPLRYYRCCVDALEGRLRISIPEEFRTAQTADGEEPDDGALICPCSDRAALMGALSELMLELDADYSDGIRLHLPRGEVHIAPLASRSALRVAVRSPDAEFARTLTLSAKELIEALDGGQQRKPPYALAKFPNKC